MSELHDTSRIPDGDAHWDALAVRVAAHAAHASRAHSLKEGSAFSWFANSGASWAAASVIFAAAVALTLLQLRGAGGGEVSAEWTDAVGPSDGLARVVMSTNGPPSVGALLLVSKPEDFR